MVDGAIGRPLDIVIHEDRLTLRSKQPPFLQIAMQKIGLSPHLFHYFALCLMKCGKEDQQVGEGKFLS